MKTKNVYITPVMEVHSVQLEMVCESIGVNSKVTITQTEVDNGSFTKAANDRRSVNEDGLRDWNIDLW